MFTASFSLKIIRKSGFSRIFEPVRSFDEKQYVKYRNSRLVWLVRNSLKFEIGDWVFVSSSYLAWKSKTSWWCLISFYIFKLEFKEFWTIYSFTGFLFCNAFQHIKKTVDSRIWFWFNYVAWQKRKKCKMSPVSPLT